MGILDSLEYKDRLAFQAVRQHAEALLNALPRFPYFTLHGKKHFNNMFLILDFLLTHGIDLSRDEIKLIVLAICVHDLGMVVPLEDSSYKEILGGKPQASDPASLESYIRDVHHELIDRYITQHFDFLSSLGISPPDCGLIKDIARCHRRLNLNEEHGLVRNLGALIRVIDELDIGPERAPAPILRDNYNSMDATSCWHWFKHNITDSWRWGHNVITTITDGRKIILFKVIVRPPRERSINYWLKQSMRPLFKTLIDDGAANIVQERWGVQIRIEAARNLSKANPLGGPWNKIEEIALSAGRKVIMIIDDEVRKMEDLMIPLMDDFHIIFSPNANDALSKIEATNVNLAIVDLQVGSGFIWSPEETDTYKLTGKKLCEEIMKISPQTKIGILTGTRYDLQSVLSLPLEFLFKKPVDPEVFEEKIYDVLGFRRNKIGESRTS